MVTKCWKVTHKSKNTIFWRKGDKIVSVSDIPATKQFFTFVDPGKNFKARTEIARNKKEALKFARAYMKKNNKC